MRRGTGRRSGYFLDFLPDRQTMAEALIPTSQYPYGTYPFQEFNRLQSIVFPEIESNANVIVSAPTSSGKTIAAEMFAGKTLHEGKKVIYTSPLKALVEEKCIDWKDPSHPWAAKNLFLMTGDYQVTPKREKELLQADIIISTYEMLSVRSRRSSLEKTQWILDTGLLIVDEAHFISSEGRGDHLESALIGFSRLNSSARIVFLSATMRNAKEIANWLEKLTGKPTSLLESTWRPCPLTIHFKPVKLSGYVEPWRVYAMTEDLKISALKHLIQEYPDDQWLVFVHSKATGKKAFEVLKTVGITNYHNADLQRDSRLDIERKFREGKIRYLIATSTLAYGVNLPARRVAILGVNRGISEVDSLDVVQECGRAGRPKYDTEGDAYVILELGKLTRWQELLQSGVDVKSNLHRNIGFHLISEIAEKRVSTPEAATSWSDRTLSSHQSLWRTQDISPLFERFTEERLIQKADWADTPTYEVTTLGRIAAHFYFDPFDVVAWKKNLATVRDKSLIMDDAALAWLLTTIPSNAKGYVPKDMQVLSNTYLAELRLKNLFPMGGAMGKGTMLFYHIRSQEQHTRPYYSVYADVLSNAERITTCLSLIDTMLFSNHKPGYWKQVKNRLRYGVGWQEAQLCFLKGIGKHSSQTLVEAGIVSVRGLLLKKSVAREVLPPRIYQLAVTHAERIFRGRTKKYVAQDSKRGIGAESR